MSGIWRISPPASSWTDTFFVCHTPADSPPTLRQLQIARVSRIPTFLQAGGFRPGLLAVPFKRLLRKRPPQLPIGLGDLPLGVCVHGQPPSLRAEDYAS